MQILISTIKVRTFMVWLMTRKLLGKNADQLSSFRNRKGKVFYVTDLHPNRSCCADVLVAIAWKANIKDTFGIIHVLSFDDYIFCLENRYFTYFKEFLTIS
jgi:hypothetical protein